MPASFGRLHGPSRNLPGSLGLAAAALFVAACGTSPATARPRATPYPASTRAWMDAGAPIDVRVGALLADMTVVLGGRVGKLGSRSAMGGYGGGRVFSTSLGALSSRFITATCRFTMRSEAKRPPDDRKSLSK